MSVQAFFLDTGGRNSRDGISGFVASVIFHLVLLMVGGAILIKPVEYGVDRGFGGVEVQLVAAPAPEISVVQPAPEPIVEEKEIIPLPKDDVIVPEPPKIVTLPTIPIEKKKEPVLITSDLSQKGDGSSRSHGTSETTVHSSGGALTEAKPDYLKNPAPTYPWEARRKGWEGTVLLKVRVDKDGNAANVFLEKSSGFSLLDAQAMKAVWKWKFQPARLGNIPVESNVRVPVRFQLSS